MSSAGEARRLHREQALVISHVDLPAELHLRRRYGASGALLRDWMPRCRRAGVSVLVCAVFLQPERLPDLALSVGLEQLTALLEELEGAPFRLVRSLPALEEALAGGEIALLLSLEGGGALRGLPSLLRVFRALGFHFLGLTKPDRALAEEAWKLGMALDVSGLDDEGLSLLLSWNGGPVFASRSNCRALCPHSRNRTDEQIRAIAERGGVVGVSQVRALVRPEGAALADLRDHILRMESLAGPGCTGLGVDLARPCLEALPGARPRREDLLADLDALPALTALLLESGLSPSAAAGVLGGNFLRFFRNTLPRT